MSTTAIATTPEIPQAEPAHSAMIGFGDSESFKHVQRVAKLITSSNLVPENFRGDANIGNAVIALNMSNRMGADVMAVMQNIYIVHGKPSWSSQFIIACVNSCGRYSPLRFQVTGEGDDKACVAWAVERGSGERLEGPPVSIAMAKSEGWFTKNGSKWKTMPDLMLRYRAATFFGRLYAPELLMGMQTDHEVIDIEGTVVAAKPAVEPLTFAPRKPVLTPAPITIAPSNDVPIQQAAKKAKPPEASDAPTVNHARAIKLSLPGTGSTEAKLLQFLRDNGMIDDSLSSIDEIAEVKPKVLEHVVNAWADVSAAIGKKEGVAK